MLSTSRFQGAEGAPNKRGEKQEGHAALLGAWLSKDSKWLGKKTCTWEMRQLSEILFLVES